LCLFTGILFSSAEIGVSGLKPERAPWREIPLAVNDLPLKNSNSV
jgi:hypothetical protein